MEVLKNWKISFWQKSCAILKIWKDNFIHIIRNRKSGAVRSILKSDDGMGVVEVILIIVVLIGLVIIFQTNIKSVVSSIFATIEKNAGQVK